MHRVEHVMGMPIVVAIRDEHVEHGVVEGVFDWFRWVDAVFSTYRADSEISRLNAGELSLAHAHPDVRAVLRRCDELRDETDGFFDIRTSPGSSIDPSGFVKGWSVDRASLLLDRAGVLDYAVNAGGDLVLRGRPWRIGVQHPGRRDAVARVVELANAAVATSGEYARGAHIVDPHTHRAPHGILSVTVTGRDLATSDAYATAAFAMGARRAPHWTARLEHHEAMTILADGRVLSTPGFPEAQPAPGPLTAGSQNRAVAFRS
jgi:thiamine biosynthesis lipoprotein